MGIIQFEKYMYNYIIVINSFFNIIFNENMVHHRKIESVS